MKNSGVLYLTSISNEQWQPEHKQTHQIIEKQKEPKLNKNILIAKTLEAFKTKAKFFPFKIPIPKKCSKPILVPEIGPVLYQPDLKKIHWPLKID